MKNFTLFIILFLLGFNLKAQFKHIKTDPNVKEVAKLINADRIDGSKVYAKSDDNLANVKIITDNNRPVFIEGNPKRFQKINFLKNKSSMANAGLIYMETIKNKLGIKNAIAEFKEIQENTDENGTTHVKFQQYYKNLPVLNSEIIFHQDVNNNNSLNGRFVATPDINIVSKISNVEAIKIVQGDIKSIKQNFSDFEKKILNYDQPNTNLCIFNNDSKESKLAYQITIRPNLLERWEYIIDANSGAILQKSNHTCSFVAPISGSGTDLNGVRQNLNIYQTNGTNYLIDATKNMYNSSNTFNADDPQGVIWTINATNTTSDNMKVSQITSSSASSWNATAVSAHYNAGKAYDYYNSVYGRKSLNGKGGTIISIINIADDDGTSMENAFWNGQFMGYGNGGSTFKPLAGGLDVAGHEMTHGVIENTANLNYQGQSGAINESLADCFGALIDFKSNWWQIGEDVMRNGGVLRDLKTPSVGSQPATMSQYQNITEDNGGVHINSGIPNNAFYRFLTAIGTNNKNVAEKIYYNALANYLTRNSKFLDLRLALIKSAANTYPNNPEYQTALKTAFDAVGITDSGSTNTNSQGGGTESSTIPATNIPQQSGTQFILSYAPGEKKLYISDSNVSDNSFVVLASNVNLEHKPSVTADGSYAVYVSDSKLYLADLKKKTVTTLSDQSVWLNAAVTKDGKRLAAISTEDNDKTIYIFDLVGNTQKAFTLYNPSYSGVTTGEVTKADALEWDYTGQIVVYDAENIVKTTSTNLSYYDVGFLSAWNKSSNTFGKGTIQKLYTSLDKGENIGNPSFSKLSTNILAFDYVNFDDNTYQIIATDIERPNDYKVVFDNNTLGYPDYSADDKYLIFNYQYSKTSIYSARVALKSNKIEASETPKLFIQDSGYAVWYTSNSTSGGGSTGTVLANEAEAIMLNTYPNPVSNELSIVSQTNLIQQVIILNNSGKLMLENTYNTKEAKLDLSKLTSGLYIINCKLDNGNTITKKIVKN